MCGEPAHDTLGEHALTASILGIMTGLVLGLTGAGGGILAVPALVVGLGFNMTTATPVALIAVGSAALVGAIDGLHKHQVRYKAAFFMAFLGAIFSSAGVRLAHTLPETFLATLFSMIMLLIAVRMIRQGRGKTGSTHPDSNKPCRLNPATGRLQWTRRCALTLAGIGSVTGLFAGMLGVGGGFIIIPAFRRFTNIDIRSIISTSLMLIALVSLSAAAGTVVLHGVIIPSLGWVFIVSAIAGMAAGRSVAARIPARLLQQGFAALTFTVAVILLIRVWLPALID